MASEGQKHKTSANWHASNQAKLDKKNLNQVVFYIIHLCQKNSSFQILTINSSTKLLVSQLGITKLIKKHKEGHKEHEEGNGGEMYLQNAKKANLENIKLREKELK